jgi:acylphosphatase
MGRLQLLLRGRVQGVGFRWFVRQFARQLGLNGWVTNLPDGGVRLVAEGAVGSLDRLRGAVAKGPPSADVTALIEEPPDTASTLPHPFEIK